MLEAFPIAQQPSMIVTKVIATLRQIVENKAGLLESEVKVEQRHYQLRTAFQGVNAHYSYSEGICGGSMVT